MRTEAAWPLSYVVGKHIWTRGPKIADPLVAQSVNPITNQAAQRSFGEPQCSRAPRNHDLYRLDVVHRNPHITVLLGE